MVFLHRVAQLQIFGALRVKKSGASPHNEDLADFLLKRELVERFFGPLVAAFRMGKRLRLFFFGERSQREHEDEAEEKRAAESVHGRNDKWVGGVVQRTVGPN